MTTPTRTGNLGQRPLARLLEQSLFFQPHLELFELQLQLADSLGLDDVGNKLKITARLVERHATVSNYGAAFLDEVGPDASAPGTSRIVAWRPRPGG